MLGGRIAYPRLSPHAKRANGTPGMRVRMNVMVKGTGGGELDFKACLPWEGGGFVESGPLGLSSAPELLCRPPVWAGGWDARDSGTFLLLHFPIQPSLPRGEGNGRAQEGCVAKPSVQPGLGTLPEAPETMPGMEAGLARGRPREGAGAVSTPFTSLAPARHGGSQHHPRLLGSLPGPRLLPTHPLAATSHAILPEGPSPPQLGPNPQRTRVCVWGGCIRACECVMAHE